MEVSKRCERQICVKEDAMHLPLTAFCQALCMKAGSMASVCHLALYVFLLACPDICRIPGERQCSTGNCKHRTSRGVAFLIMNTDSHTALKTICAEYCPGLKELGTVSERFAQQSLLYESSCPMMWAVFVPVGLP